MASNREKLEKRAEKLGLSFVPDTTDEELQQLINDFQNDANQNEFGEGYCFYKSPIAGLAIALPADDPEDRSELHQEVRFTPYEVFDEAKGEHERVGYLATDEQDVQEVLADDPNVEEIDEAEYKEATEKYKKVG